MGVPKFYGQWLKTRGYKGLLQNFIPSEVSSLLIDMNGLIHSSAQEVYAYGEGANPVREKEVADRFAQPFWNTSCFKSSSLVFLIC